MAAGWVFVYELSVRVGSSLNAITWSRKGKNLFPQRLLDTATGGGL